MGVVRGGRVLQGISLPAVLVTGDGEVYIFSLAIQFFTAQQKTRPSFLVIQIIAILPVARPAPKFMRNNTA
jgi:hypothetical protein